MTYNSRSSSGDGFTIGCGLVIVVAVLAMLVVGIVGAFHVETHQDCVVNGKDRTTGHDGKSDMRVYTDNCGTFRVGDSILSGTWHSADTYASIEPGHTYDFETRGFRIPFFSHFPNIVKATEVN